MFKKFLSVAVAASVIATASLGATTQAQANNVGLGIVAGILGGVVVGTAIANENHRHHVYYEDNVVVCKKVLYEDHYGNRFWKKSCH